MNNTKWTEIFHVFYYEVELHDEKYGHILPIIWTTKTLSGYVCQDSTWTHFGIGLESSKEIDWLKIELTEANRSIVLDILRRVHVPREVFDDCVFVYGYRTDIDYIQ